MPFLATHSLEVGLSIPEAWKTFNPRLAIFVHYRHNIPPVLISFLFYFSFETFPKFGTFVIQEFSSKLLFKI